MDADQLKTFLEVNRTRHFGRAAQNLFLSQSAVSARIQTLEDQLGTPLFVRSRNDIQLTAAGHRLLSHAENILAAWNRARHDVAIEESSASLAIAGTPSLWDITLQQWLHALHHEQPGIAILAEVLDADIIQRRIMEGTLDLGFTFEPPRLAQVEVKQIATIPLVMVSSHEAISCMEALKRDYVSVNWGLSFAIAHARHFPEAGASTINLPLGRIALEYILACGGSAYLAQPMVEHALENEQLFRVTDAPVIERPAFALFSPASPRLELIQKTLTLLP